MNGPFDFPKIWIPHYTEPKAPVPDMTVTIFRVDAGKLYVGLEWGLGEGREEYYPDLTTEDANGISHVVSPGFLGDAKKVGVQNDLPFAQIAGNPNAFSCVIMNTRFEDVIRLDFLNRRREIVFVSTKVGYDVQETALRKSDGTRIIQVPTVIRRDDPVRRHCVTLVPALG